VLTSSLPLQLRAQASEDMEISWEGPPSCPRQAQFDAQLDRLRGGGGPTRRRTAAHVRILAGDAGDFALHLTIDAPYGRSERDLTVPTCAQAQHAAALLIAAAVDMVDEESLAEIPNRQSESAAEARYMLRVGAFADVGSLPAGSVGPSVGVGFAGAFFRSWADARYLVPRRARDDDSSLVADLELFSGAVGLAGLWKVGPLALGPCVELEIGALRARADGELDAHRRATLWLGSSAGLMLSRPRRARRVADLALALLASVPWLRQPFALGDEAPFYATSGLAFRAAMWLSFDVRSKS
jgi:hypothetical protein